MDPTLEIPMAHLTLTFDQNLLVMIASVLPAIILCMMQYLFLDILGERCQILAISCAMITAFRAGIAPAFFTRVDHPLHWLDRVRWILSCLCLTALLLTASCSDGSVYAYNLFRPHESFSLSNYTEATGKDFGLITLKDAAMDMVQVGSAPHCTDCTAQQCVVKDCRSAARLAQLSRWDPPSVAEVSGGGSCSITCLYVAPLYLAVNGSSSSSPMAWAVRNALPPRTGGGVITGTSHVWWWVGSRKDYQGAIDEVILQRFSGLSRCNGQQPLPMALPECLARGYDICRVQKGLLSKCCCPMGHKVVGRSCAPCAGTLEKVKAWHSLPFLYILPPEAGCWAFAVMCLWSLVLLPLPWAILAKILWRHVLRSQKEQLRHYLVHHRRHVVADEWRAGARPAGPMVVQVSSMAGDTKDLVGFSSSTLLAHLRRSISESFQVPFPCCGLAQGAKPLTPEMDFKTLGDLGIEHGSQLYLVYSKEGSAGPGRSATEGNALSFFGRTEKRGEADCDHAELHIQPAVEGWVCNACEKLLGAGLMRWRCETCELDFCGECAAMAELFND